MMLEVTRDVVSDLWPLRRSGEASDDSRKLIDAFLAEDLAFAATLRESEKLGGMVPALHLSPDAERRLLDDARERARAKMLIIGAAVALTGILLLASLGGAMFMMFHRL